MSQPAQDRSKAVGGAAKPSVKVKKIPQAVLEIVSDAGEGAQTAGQLFGTIGARMGNGIWTVEIIPAEIEPPPRTKTGASGIRVRFATEPVTNMGDRADVVVAFNEQVLYGRIDQDALGKGTILLIDDHWGSSPMAEFREAYATALEDFRSRGIDVREVPMRTETLKLVSNPRRGQNMWVVGMLCAMFSRDLDIAKEEITKIFTKKRKGQKVIDSNHRLIQAGYDWGMANLSERYEVPAVPTDKKRLVMNGNAAIAMGAMAAGIEVCSMYPITPATSASHFLAASFHKTGGFVHQAEDEIAAVGFAIGASWAGKTALTITSGPGMALKTEMIGLAVMAEIPLVIVDVQRGGPSTGLPTKVEQGDLLHSLWGHPGDSPKIVMAPSSIDECLDMMVTARKLAEDFRTPVIVLTDANLATGQTIFDYPELSEDKLSPPVDQSPWDPNVLPYDWDPETGLSARPIPGQRGGEYALTGLAHDEHSHVAYESDINQRSMSMRSKKIATLQKTLKAPEVFGADEGDLLVVGWGSTRGAIEEVVTRLRKKGHKISSTHLRFLSPLEPGLMDIFKRFKKVMTVEINYSDDPNGSPETRRYAQLATVLRAQTLMDIDCWSRVPGQPLPPMMIEEAVMTRLKALKGGK